MVEFVKNSLKKLINAIPRPKRKAKRSGAKTTAKPSAPKPSARTKRKAAERTASKGAVRNTTAPKNPSVKSPSTGTGTTGTAESAGRINVNTADREELMKISGIGEIQADRILEHRGQHGAFRKIEDLKDVHGISDAILERIRAQIVL